MSLFAMFRSTGPSGFGYGSTAEQVTEGLSLAGQTILVTGLLGQLTDEGRVVMLSSVGHTRAPAAGIDFDNLSGDKGYQPLSAYGQSKLANLLFAKELQRRFAGTRKTAYAVHPGPVSTNLARDTGPVLSRVLGAIGLLFFKSVAEGAATQVFAAVHPKALPLAGSYLCDSNVGKPRADAEDAGLAARLWTKSEEIVQALEVARHPVMSLTDEGDSHAHTTNILTRSSRSRGAPLDGALADGSS